MSDLVADAGTRTDSGTIAPVDSGQIDGSSGLKRAFITRSKYPGDFDGVSPHQLCSEAAVSGQLGGRWRAFIQTSTDALPARDALAGLGPWENLNGEVLFSEISIVTAADIVFNEFRQLVPDTGTGAAAWTGLDEEFATGDSCENWTNASSGDWGDVGTPYSSSSSGGWIHWGGANCNSRYRLYCFET